jgi:BCD family chlorophyll transporter-like MFS transporter
MDTPFTGYSVVYHVEMLFLFITLVAIGPLVRKSVSKAPDGAQPNALLEARS